MSSCYRCDAELETPLPGATKYALCDGCRKSTLPGGFDTFFTRSKNRVSPEVLQALATILKALFEEEPILELPSDRERAAQKLRIQRAARGVATRRKNQKKKKLPVKRVAKRKAKRK